VRQHSVATLVGAQLDYWAACAVGKRRPVIVDEAAGEPECLVEIDGTSFEPFAPFSDPELADSLISGSPVRLMRIGTPIGPSWAALTPTGLRYLSMQWHVAGLRALVGLKYGPFVFDEVEE
jgi:hypothetical protein